MLKDPPATLDEPDTDCEVIEKLRAENERLRAALMPFAAVGRPFVAACESGALPSGASARYLKLEPLIAEDFANAARAYEQSLTEKP